VVDHYQRASATHKDNLAMLAINTLQKDCVDEDPMARGLALRSLTSLRFVIPFISVEQIGLFRLPNIIEYAMLPLRKGLNDPSPYVRKTAVTGVAKLYRLYPQQIKGSILLLLVRLY